MTSSTPIRPVFIFSLPRSGSTLLQRMLTAHPRVASVAEPWVLLPIAGMTERNRIRSYADYSGNVSALAIREMIDALPRGRTDYAESVRDFVLGLYAKLAAPGTTHFLDKTPRYYLIIDFIREVFPDAGFVFLFRNPLEVMSSMITTWSNGRLWLHHHHMDLFDGPRCMHEALPRHRDQSFVLTYRELVEAPEETCRRLTAYLGIEFEPQMVTGFQKVKLEGTMGDPTGVNQYATVAKDSLDRWRTVLDTPVRRWYAGKYLDALGAEVLTTFGESLPALRAEVRSMRVRPSRVASDVAWLSASAIGRYSAAKVLKAQWSARGSSAVVKLD